jgi:hypothetical protein
VPGQSARYQVLPIPGFHRHYVGKDEEGAPVLLLGSVDAGWRAPLRLAGIDARFAVPCHIIDANGTAHQETLTSVVCTVRDHALRPYIAHVGDTILRIIDENPTLDVIADAVRRLVELFQRLAQPATRSVIGLFGELYVIHRSADPIIAVRAWRSDVDDRFDFSIDDARMEVKASSNRLRAHNFSAEQCSPPPGTDGVMVSLVIEASGGGLSLKELIDRIETKLWTHSELILKIHATVAETLGDGMPAAFNMRFDEQVAASSLKAYDPRIASPNFVTGCLTNDVTATLTLGGVCPEYFIDLKPSAV